MGDLIARLEQAAKGSREFDRLIFDACGGQIKTVAPYGEFGGTAERWTDAEGTRWHPEATYFTTDLNAAVELVPENWTAWEVRSRQRKTAFVAEVSRLGDAPDYDEDEQRELAHASTPALALCAAALKARAHG